MYGSGFFFPVSYLIGSKYDFYSIVFRVMCLPGGQKWQQASLIARELVFHIYFCNTMFFNSKLKMLIS